MWLNLFKSFPLSHCPLLLGTCEALHCADPGEFEQGLAQSWWNLGLKHLLDQMTGSTRLGEDNAT